MTTIDSCIWQSVQNILQAQVNLEKLFDAFDCVECFADDLAIEWDDSDGRKGALIQPAWNIYFTVKKRNPRNFKTVGWITIAIQLTCSEGREAEWEFGKRSKVLVGYSHGRDFEYAWEFDAESPNAAGYCEGCVADGCHWKFDDEDKTSWFYGVPLDFLTSTDAVRKYVAEPLHKIIRGSELEDVLKDIQEQLCPPPAELLVS